MEHAHVGLRKKLNNLGSISIRIFSTKFFLYEILKPIFYTKLLKKLIDFCGNLNFTINEKSVKNGIRIPYSGP